MINMMRPRALYTDTALASFILVIQKFESRITDDPSWLNIYWQVIPPKFSDAADCIDYNRGRQLNAILTYCFCE